MTLYRAVYQSPVRAGSRIRAMTFAAADPRAAERMAEKWALADKLLTLRAVRTLQAQPSFPLVLA